jgi:hypothetical protein
MADMPTQATQPPTNTNMKPATLYQPEQKGPKIAPTDDSPKVTADEKGVHFDIPWSTIRCMIKPIGLVLSHLTTAGLTWATTVQHLPPPVQTPVIAHTQSITNWKH